MTETDNNVVNPAEDNYIETIKQLKANTVSKADYDKLVSENAQLLKAFTEFTPGSTEPKAEVIPSKEDIDNMRKSLFKQNSGITNLEYIETALKLRDAVIKSGGSDPFAKEGSAVDSERAVEIADALQQLVDYADGNKALFCSELKRVCK